MLCCSDAVDGASSGILRCCILPTPASLQRPPTTVMSCAPKLLGVAGPEPEVDEQPRGCCKVVHPHVHRSHYRPDHDEFLPKTAQHVRTIFLTFMMVLLQTITPLSWLPSNSNTAWALELASTTSTSTTMISSQLLLLPTTTTTSTTNSNTASASAGGGMACVASQCSRELSSCLTNRQCAAGLTCFVQCAATDMNSANGGGGGGGTVAEGACQTRCMDLYQSPVLDAFTDCTLTEKRCYPQLKADVRYPPFTNRDRTRLWQDDLVATASSSSSSSNALLVQKLRQLFDGRWYIAAGLNPTFDTFDCQTHDFVPNTNINISNNKKDGVVIADATFAYRVQLGSSPATVDPNHKERDNDNGSNRRFTVFGPWRRTNKNNNDDNGSKNWFTKTGDKRLTLYPSPTINTMDNSANNDQADYLQFDPRKKWGIDSFLVAAKNNGFGQEPTTLLDGTAMKGTPSPTESASASAGATALPQLVLSLRPAFMNYRDEWIVLTSSRVATTTDAAVDYALGHNNDYMVLVYRGSNSAWDGYGGLNIYTRNGKLPENQKDLADIQAGLYKVGLQLEDLIVVDNSCVYSRR